jgi:hypothetical protein
MLHLLSEAGLLATLRLLTTGQLDRGALQAHAITLLSQETGPVIDPGLAPRFAAAGIATAPYAAALGVSLRFPPADGPMDTLISDSDWVSLQGLCSR